MNTITKTCLYCKKEFNNNRTSTKRSYPCFISPKQFENQKTCSRNCACAFRIANRKVIVCPTCNKDFQVIYSRNKFCSQKCANVVLAKLNKLNTERRIKISIKLKGSSNGNWQGGITPINENIRHTVEYKLWRESVFKRDAYTCMLCSKKNGLGKTVILNADHIKPFAHYPALRYEIDNGRTLCVSCHRKTDTYGFKSNKKLI